MKTPDPSRRLCSSLAMLAAVFLLSGCGAKQGIADAEVVVVRHFSVLATNGVTVALADYGPQFFAKVKKEDWSKALEKIPAKLGDYQSHSVAGRKYFVKAGTDSGTYIDLVCQVNYSKHRAQEKFRLFRADSTTDFKIIGHFISSEGFLKE